MPLMGTKRMLGRVTASQIAAASAASFLPRLPEAVGDDELGRHQTHGVAELRKLARPVVSAGAGLHADQARWQRGDGFEQLGARDAGTHQRGLARFIHAVNGKDGKQTANPS